MSDAPGQKLYVLLGPDAAAQSAAGGIPDVLCVLQVAMEGQISKQSVDGILSRGQRASGDLIPWTVSQQFQDSEFAGLSGARVVRIATHHDVSGMGYGSRALELLTRYFSGEMTSLNVDDDSGGEDEEKGNKDDAEDATDDEEDDEVGPLSLSLSLSLSPQTFPSCEVYWPGLCCKKCMHHSKWRGFRKKCRPCVDKPNDTINSEALFLS